MEEPFEEARLPDGYKVVIFLTTRSILKTQRLH